MAEGKTGPFVVDIPMRNLWPSMGAERKAHCGDGKTPEPAGQDPSATKVAAGEGAAPRMCAATKADGTPCSLIAARGKTMCARHDRWYRALPMMMGMPYPEDAVALQDVMAQVVVMVLNREVDAERARAVAHLCQVMQRNLKDYRREVMAVEIEERRWSRVQ